MSVDLSNYTLVLDENFDTDLSVYDGQSGIWTTSPRRDVLVTNGPESVFVSDTTATSDGEGVGLDPLTVEDGVLKIGSGVIPDENLAAVQDALTLAGQEEYVDKAEYYTGMIATDETWGQEYGYFEIRAQIPEGKGHWPAFWLAPAGEGWPPEIDIFEAYGKGNNKATGSDDTFSVAVFFDETDAEGNDTQNVDITNPYVLDANGNPTEPVTKTKSGGEISKFGEKIDAQEEYGADIYNDYWVWACEWTPESITFYFGKDSESLVEVYKAPTPEDANALMYLIANDQISSTFGWNPVEGEDDQTFAADNTFNIDYIKVYALDPTVQLYSSKVGADLVDDDGTTEIHGTKGNDRIVTANGQDYVDLTAGGSDAVFVERGEGNKLIDGFSSQDDKIVLDGFFFEDTTDVLARLTQVGDDVWLANGADPANPQTIVFQNRTVESFQADDFVIRWSVTKDIWSSAIYDESRLKDEDGDGVVTAVSTGSKMTDDGSSYKGAMSLVGSAEGDLYYVYKTDTKITESAGGGVDTVYAFKDYVLPENVENLLITVAKEGQKATGNGLGNRLEGTTAGEVFTGAKGDDLIVTGGGADKIVYNAGDGYDTIEGFDANDVLTLKGISFASFDELKSRLIVYGSDVVLDLGTGQSITFRGTSIETLTAANFVFDVGKTNVVGKGIDPNYVPSVSSEGVSFDPPKEETPVDVPEEEDHTEVPPPAPVIPTVRVVSGSSDDRLQARTDEKHVINAGGGIDTVMGRGGDDELYGEGGDDNIQGKDGNDKLYGGDGADKIGGGSGNDWLYGDEGDDRLSGDEGDDVLMGGNGSDTLSGDAGVDLLYGGAGVDTLKGGDGNDVLDGGTGSDRLFGEGGADRFIISEHQAGDIARLIDFSLVEGDWIDLSALFGPEVTQANMADYVQVVQNRANVFIQVDLDGAGSAYSFDTYAQVLGVTAADVSHGLFV